MTAVMTRQTAPSLALPGALSRAQSRAQSGPQTRGGAARPSGRPAGRPMVARPAVTGAPVTHTIYVRRRLLVGAVALLLGLVAWSGADSVFANRGSAPASAPVVGGTSTYVVLSGDSFWSIAEEFRGATPLDEYLDQLLALHGSPVLFAGEVITLP